MKLLVAVSTIVALLIAVPAASAAPARDAQEGPYKGTADTSIGSSDSVKFVVAKASAHDPTPAVLGFSAPGLIGALSPQMGIAIDGHFKGTTRNGDVITGTVKSDGTASGKVDPRGSAETYTWTASLRFNHPNVDPRPGAYEGKDDDHNTITFNVDANGDKVTDFRAGDRRLFSSIPLAGGMFSENGNAGAAGFWVNDHTVSGDWWDGTKRSSLFKAELK
jgi:hypothetical protein